MKIVRYTLSGNERLAIKRLATSVNGVQGNHQASRESRGKAVHVSRERPDAETGHYLVFENCNEELTELAGLRRCIDSHTKASEVSALLIIERLPDAVELASPVLLLLGTMLGEVREYPGYSEDLMKDVSARTKFALRHQTPSSDNNLEFPPHTDLAYYPHPAAFLCFLMLSQGAAGGETLMCDPMDFVAGLSSATLEALQRPFKVWAPPGVPGADTRHFPVLARVGRSAFSVRYRREYLEPLETAQEKALEEWRAGVDAHTTQYTLAAGEMAIHSNTRLLHGRRRFRDGVIGGRVRRARRAWVVNSPPDADESWSEHGQGK